MTSDVLDRLCLKGRILENPVVRGRNMLSKITNDLFAGLLGKKNSVDVGKDTIRSNCDTSGKLV